MMRAWLLAIGVAMIIATPIANQAAPCDVFCHSRLAAAADSAGDLVGYATHVRAVAAIAPSHPAVVYQMARMFARTAEPDSAVITLARLGRMGDTHDPDGDSAFARLRGRVAYRDARRRLLANRLPVLDGRRAFEIADPDFLPEALAYDGARDRFLVGSLAQRLIAAFTPTGVRAPYIAHATPMLRVVGIHADSARGRLWFATWAPDSAFRGSGEAPSLTRLFLAELASGRVVDSWAPDGGRPGHLLNDFVVMSDGRLYITDTERGTIYMLRSPRDTLEVFVQPDVERFSVANGIAASGDGHALFAAFLEGVARIDLRTRTVTLLPAPDSVSTAAVDGLYWYRNGLIAVQGVPTLQRVVRYVLSPDGDRITAGAVLERGPAAVLQPTTGVIVGDRFYYIANSQYGRLDDRGGLAPAAAPAVRTAVRVIPIR